MLTGASTGHVYDRVFCVALFEAIERKEFSSVRNHEKPEDPDAQISSFVCRERPIVAATSTGRCNTFGKTFCRCIEA